MRLITHNVLQCHAKNCNANNFPLAFENAKLELVEADFNPEFLVNFLPNIHWEALYTTAMKLGISTLPPQIPDNVEGNEEFLRVLHTALLETHITEGIMRCPNCQHEYKIRDGIPNMLLAEHEI